IAEQTIFPEIDPDKVEYQQGMNVTIVTSAKNDREARALLRLLGVPFQTEE
ncbi:MAG: 50S ribosomal protein L5, partial [Phycisphaerae bacterium]|nr:50S ribosomal protein L5 [Phycisphaerae bacterium]